MICVLRALQRLKKALLSDARISAKECQYVVIIHIAFPCYDHALCSGGLIKRCRAQAFIQGVLEEEVGEPLGRRKSERRETDDPVGYRNGHGEERRLTTSIGTVKIRRPRVRGDVC